MTEKLLIWIEDTLMENLGLYSGEREPTRQGYRQRPLDHRSLDWRWYVDEHGSCVQAVMMGQPFRISIGAGCFDAPEGCYLVRNFRSVWAEPVATFLDRYSPVEALVHDTAIRSWEERVGYEMERYECACTTGWYPPIVDGDDDPRQWSEQQKDDLEAEWHIERGWSHG